MPHMPMAKIREERARLLRDDAVLPGSPTTRQRAPGGRALTYVLYALGGTLYVMLHRRVRRRSHSVPGQPPAVRERAPRAAGRPSRLHRRRVPSYGAVDAKGGEVVRGWG